MKAILFENFQSSGNKKICEFFGLSRSGKTTSLNELIKSGRSGLKSWSLPNIKKVFLFLKFFIKNPLKTSKLILILNLNWIDIELNFSKKLKVFSLRNSYLSSVLAKYEFVHKKEEDFFVDEFIFQSIFMILVKKSNKKKIKKIISLLPPSGKIILIESSKKERLQRIKKTRLPAQQIDKKYAQIWMDNMEYNYKIILDILKKEHGSSKDIKLSSL